MKGFCNSIDTFRHICMSYHALFGTSLTWSAAIRFLCDQLLASRAADERPSEGAAGHTDWGGTGARTLDQPGGMRF